MQKLFKRKLLAGILSACMMFQTVGMVPVYAVENGANSGLPSGTSSVCTHHSSHDETCGFTEGTPCNHTHTADCYTDELICGFSEEVVDSGTKSNATHTHTQECYKLNCPHENGKHDDTCGYAEGKTTTEFASGAVTWLLNGSYSGATDGSQSWYQTLGTGGDAYPVLESNGNNTVYQHGTNYSNNIKPSDTITWVEQSTNSIQVYDGTAKSLSIEKGVDFTWLGTGTASIESFYIDQNGTKTTTENSGAASEGAAPVHAGTYYVKITVTEDENYF